MRPFTMICVSAALGVSACGSEPTSPESVSSMGVAEVTAADYSVIDLGTLGGTSSAALAINNAGQIVGSSLIGGDMAEHVFLWQDGGMQDLGA